MDNPAAPPLDSVLSLGQSAVNTVLTKPPAEVEADMHRLATFAQAHLDSVPGPLTYRRALVALLTVAKDTMITAATHAHHHHLKGLVTDAPPIPRVVRFDQPRSEKPGPAAPTLLGALPIRGRGLVEQPKPSWRAYAHEQLLSRLNRVRFMADLSPDEPAAAAAPEAAPATVIEPEPEPEATTVPCWHADLRELSIGGKVVKSFRRQKAKNQTAVLADFEAKGWPTRIENAPVHPDQIGDTVAGLNKWAKDAGLVFKRDGTGEGILWKLL